MIENKRITEGMRVKIKGIYKQDFLITKVDEEKETFTIEGDFSDKDLPLQTITLSFEEIFGDDLEYSKFSIVDYPKWDDEVLVSNDNDTWHIRRFYGFEKDGRFITRMCAADDCSYDKYGDSIGDTMVWKYMKQVNF